MKTGIFPYNSNAVLSIIQHKKQPTPKGSSEKPPPTPMSCRAVRHAQRIYKKQPTKENLAVIFRATERLAAQRSIDEHVKKGLVEALQLEKRKRARGKKLNLLGEKDSGLQFFSPAWVRAAQAFQAAKEAQEQEERDKIEDRKAQVAAKKAQKEAEKAVRALQQAARRQMAQEAKALKAEGIRAQKEQRLTRKEAREAAQRAKRQSTAVTRGRKRGIGQIVQAEEDIQAKRVKVVTGTTLRGRAVARPQRYN